MIIITLLEAILLLHLLLQSYLLLDVNKQEVRILHLLGALDLASDYSA